jgi:hypothetical protein
MLQGSMHICRFCNGDRYHNEKICLGCGMPVAQCKPVVKEPRKKHCPCCNNQGPHINIAFERYRCRGCGVIMENQDFGFIDDRPERNAVKKEEAEANARKRVKRGGYRQ